MAPAGDFDTYAPPLSLCFVVSAGRGCVLNEVGLDPIFGGLWNSRNHPFAAQPLCTEARSILFKTQRSTTAR